MAPAPALPCPLRVLLVMLKWCGTAGNQSAAALEEAEQKHGPHALEGGGRVRPRQVQAPLIRYLTGIATSFDWPPSWMHKVTK